MSKPLSSYPEPRRQAVAQRRIAQKSGGLGMFAAQDYMRAKTPKTIDQVVGQMKEAAVAAVSEGAK